jgi:hypothetical protein
VAGLIAAIALILVAVISGLWILAAAAPMATYGLNWIGHAIAGNRPASFCNPFWSVLAYFRMILDMIRGKIDF